MSADLIAQLGALSINVPASAVVEHGPVVGAAAWKEALKGKDGVPEKCEYMRLMVRYQVEAVAAGLVGLS